MIKPPSSWVPVTLTFSSEGDTENNVAEILVVTYKLRHHGLISVPHSELRKGQFLKLITKEGEHLHGVMQRVDRRCKTMLFEGLPARLVPKKGDHISVLVRLDSGPFLTDPNCINNNRDLATL